MQFTVKYFQEVQKFFSLERADGSSAGEIYKIWLNCFVFLLSFMSWMSTYICHFVETESRTYLSKQTGSCDFLTIFFIHSEVKIT